MHPQDIDDDVEDELSDDDDVPDLDEGGECSCRSPSELWGSCMHVAH